MATIPQELQDAWDAASTAKADHDAAAANLQTLTTQNQDIVTQLQQASVDEKTKAAALDQARLTFDNTADALLTGTGGVSPTVPPTTSPGASVGSSAG